MNKLYYIHSGTAFYTYKDIRHTMIPGYLYLFPASANVSFSLKEDTPFNHTFFDFFSNPMFFFDEVVKIKADDFPILNSTLSVLCEILKSFRIGTKNNNYYCFYNDNTNCEPDDIVYHYFCAVMLIINSITPIYTTFDSRIFSTLNYISNHYADKLTISQLADLVYLEQNYFIKLFKKCVGKSPHQYIKDYRIDMALTMLEQGKSITETALSCG